MEVKDKVKQRRLERLRNLRETSDPSNGSGSPVRPSRIRGNSLPTTSSFRSTSLCGFRMETANGGS